MTCLIPLQPTMMRVWIIYSSNVITQQLSGKNLFDDLSGMNLLWLGIQRSSVEWKDEMMWAIAHAKGNSVQAALYRLSVTCYHYLVWHKKNLRLFQMKSRSPEILIRLATQAIHCRGSLFPSLHSGLESRTFLITILRVIFLRLEFLM